MAEGTEPQPVVDMKNSKIVRIGIVVADAAKTAKRYSDILLYSGRSLGPFGILRKPMDIAS